MEQVETKDRKLERPDALRLARQADALIAAKGRKVVRVDLRREKPSPDELAALLLGPTGRLRAPTARVGRTLLVGFDEEAYREILRISS